MGNFVVFIWSTQVFIWSTLYFLHGQLCTFYMVNLSFYTVNFYFFIWSSWLFIWLTFYFLYGQVNFLYGQLFIWSTFLLFISVWVKCRLQTDGKVQTKGKMQTEDRRSGVKCSLGSWRINHLSLQYWPDHEAQERSVEHLEASDTKHHSKITFTFATQNKGMRTRFLLSK